MFYDKKRSGAPFMEFCAFLKKKFCKHFGFQYISMTSWGSAGGVTVLKECSSAFLIQKNFTNHYCVGPTYTNFSRIEPV